MAKTYLEVLNRASSFLEEAGKEGYAIEFLFLERKGWSKTQWLLSLNLPISAADEVLIAQDLQALLADQPPQYLLGYADFFDHRFKVTEATLIPRPETEELVDLCLREAGSSSAVVADVGTGTGAIAISLKLARPDWQVAAVDISSAALTVAKENARQLGAEITFFVGDVLAPITQPIDILISNPPYISETEWDLMDASVQLHEPKLALFAKEQGLAIYRKLATESKSCLKPGGKIFLEIGFRQGKAVQALFQEAYPEKIVEIRKDLSGLDRMIYVHD